MLNVALDSKQQEVELVSAALTSIVRDMTGGNQNILTTSAQAEACTRKQADQPPYPLVQCACIKQDPCKRCATFSIR